MKLTNTRKEGSLLSITLLCSLMFIACPTLAQAEGILETNPTLYTERTIILTSGSSTSREYQPGKANTLIGVLTFGPGTLDITLKKVDTRNDFVSMYVMGYPTSPAFVPNIGVTPAEISESIELGDTLGGVGIVFIFTSISSSKSFVSKLSLELK